MASNYTPDRWQARAIVAQNAANVAAQILAAQIAAGRRTDDTTEAFIQLQSVVFQNSIDLAGEEPSHSQEPESSPSQDSSTSSHRSGDAPYGSTEVKFGKFRGMTIAEIDAAVDDRGKSGRSWLEWCEANIDNDFMKKAIAAYLDATK